MNDTNRFSRIFGIIFLSIGAAMLVPGLILFCIYCSSARNLEMLISGGVIGVIGGVFALIGLFSLLIARKQRVKINRLMSEGECYDANIVCVYDNLYMHVNYRSPLIVECGYKDKLGKSYLVKSGNVWINPLMVKDGCIKARVWVNPDDARDYHVEVYSDAFRDDSGTTYDYDLR